MKLTTIWTLPGATLAEKWRRTGEWIAQQIAWRLPKSVRYWSTMGDLARVSCEQGGEVPAMRLDQILPKL